MSINFSIKNRLNYTMLGILFLVVILVIINIIYINKYTQHYDLINKVEEITKNQLKLRKAEKDFVLNDIYNINYCKTKKSKYISEFDSIYKVVVIQLEKIVKNKTVTNSLENSNINQLQNHFEKYAMSFHELVKAINTKGFKDYGIIGEMRDQIHKVEAQLIELSKSYKMQVYMLSLRRHEKDYLLRKDVKYKAKFQTVIDDFTEELLKKGDKKSLEMIELLIEYQKLFTQVIEEDIIIGLNPSMGLVNKLNRENDQITKQIADFQNTIKKESEREIAQAINYIVIISIVLFVLMAIIILRTSGYINHSIKSLKSYITRLGKGELPEEIRINSKDEISEMSNSINILTKNLKNTREFANEVGNGNLETEVNVFNNEGDLGSSLIEMRKKLLEVAEERTNSEIENKKRNWINEGVAKFGEILRLNNDNLKKLSYDILKYLIDYLEANQGVVYIINDEKDKDDDVVYELMSAIAYGRKKFMKDKISIGEDVLGRCAFEQKTIYMTDVPDDFIKITSGLGTANPRSVVVIPLILNDEVYGIIELASFNIIEQYQVEFIERIAVNIATTISHIKINKHTENLLMQAQEQSEAISAQEEELRQNMEELHATQEEVTRTKNEMGIKLNAISEYIYISTLDVSGNVTDINDSFLELLETPREQVLNKSFRNIIVENKSKDEYINFILDLNNNETKVTENKIRKQGEIIWLRTKYIPLINEEQNITNILALSMDITETVTLRNNKGSRTEKISYN